jgi:molybdenum cofactor cytidylyltransferase
MLRGMQNHSDGRKALGVLVLAAGSSRRMGRPKLLLPWGNTSVLGHLLQQWSRLAAAQIAVVCAKDADALREELDCLNFSQANRIFNTESERGMFSSIQCAAAWPGWNPELTHFLISLGDQPHLKHETLQWLLDVAAANPGKICQPLQAGRRRHPVVFPRTEFAALAVSTANDLKEFLTRRENQLAGFESGDPGLAADLDTPEDYERAKALYFGNL